MRREDVRRWIAGYRAGQERERLEVLAAAPEPKAAIEGALALVALAGRLHGWPLPEDDVDRGEDDAARATWNRLRAVLLTRDRKG
jgi:hypothetical protein